MDATMSRRALFAAVAIPLSAVDASFGTAVTRVVDADTLDLVLARDSVILESTVRHEVATRVRLVGIDAYEKRTDKGKEATAFVVEWVSHGALTFSAHSVTRPRDSFGRALGTLSKDGESLQDALVAAGLAVPWDGRGGSPLSWETRLRELLGD